MDQPIEQTNQELSMFYTFPFPSSLNAAFPTTLLRRDAMPPMRMPMLRRSEEGGTPSSSATMDVRETPTAFVLEFDMPGIAPESIELLAEDGSLTIKGSRPMREVADSEQMLVTEVVRGEVTRRLRLPKSANLESVQASLAHGVLTVTVAKAVSPQPRRITITSTPS
jgi:HSP20 family protein